MTELGIAEGDVQTWLGLWAPELGKSHTAVIVRSVDSPPRRSKSCTGGAGRAVVGASTTSTTCSCAVGSGGC